MRSFLQPGRKGGLYNQEEAHAHRRIVLVRMGFRQRCWAADAGVDDLSAYAWFML